MPHTSHKRKKKNQQQHHQYPSHRNKRGEMQSDDGWTQISRSDRSLHNNLPSQQARPGIMFLPPDDPDYDQSLDEGYTKMTFTSTPAEVPEGASLETALAHYHKCEDAWKQSTTWLELEKTFETRILRPDLNITRCICFGLSSPTGLILPRVDRRNCSMYQLIAFKSVIDILNKDRDIPVEAFAQEPLFNALDVELFSHLNIRVVEHPEAFHLVTPTTFTFCPGAEQFVIRGALFRSPAMHMGSGPLETYIDPQTGELGAPDIGSVFHDDARGQGAGIQSSRQNVDDDGDSPGEAKEDDEDDEEKRILRQQKKKEKQEKKTGGERTGRSVYKEKARIDAIRGAGILHHFKMDKHCYKLADSENFEYALYDLHLFWTRSSSSLE